MPRGAAPGERRGGRAKGVPNKKTIEALARAKIIEQVADAMAAPGTETRMAIEKVLEGKKLAKDELEEVLPIIKGVVAYYQRQALTMGQDGKPVINGKLDDFKEWLKIFIDTCFKLADFQSAKFKAIMVTAGPGMMGGDNARDVSPNVISMTDQTAAARAYREIMLAPAPKRLATPKTAKS